MKALDEFLLDGAPHNSVRSLWNQVQAIDRESWILKAKQRDLYLQMQGITFTLSGVERGQRHAVEVDYHLFRKELKSELKKAGVDIGKSPAGNKRLYKSFA